MRTADRWMVCQNRYLSVSRGTVYDFVLIMKEQAGRRHRSRDVTLYFAYSVCYPNLSSDIYNSVRFLAYNMSISCKYIA